MNNALNRNENLPAYHQLYVLLMESIRTGTYAPGSFLPSENELGKLYDVSRVTVRRALKLLVDDNLIVRHKGKGSAVKLPAKNPKSDRISGFVSSLVSNDLRLHVENVSWSKINCSAYIADKFNCPIGSCFYVIQRLRYINKLPLSYASIYLTENIGDKLNENQSKNRLILEMLEESGQEIDHMEYTLSASLADGQAAQSLNLPVGSPVLRMQGLGYENDGDIIYFQDTQYHPNRYEYRVDLERDKSNGKLNFHPRYK